MLDCTPEKVQRLHKQALSEAYHGLVDESSTLELNGAVGICWVGLSVFGHRPLLLWGADMHQLVLLGWLVSECTRGYSHVLCCQLTTGTSRWNIEQGIVLQESLSHQICSV